ncbi:hypothetical protein [Herbidospora sp. RD11066]
MLDRFVAAYVNVDDPGFDVRVLDELRSEGGGFTLYLRSRDHSYAIITFTDEGALVLGLSVEDDGDLGLTSRRAGELLDVLRAEFSAAAGLAGVELPPPRSRAEWDDDGMVLLRVGAPPSVGEDPVGR